jgi:predicted amidophosphoribosyltransferase
VLGLKAREVVRSTRLVGNPVNAEPPAVLELRGRSLIDFQPQVATLMHAYKELGISALATQFAAEMVPAAQQFAAEFRGPLHLVPVPSQPSSVMSRGYSPAGLIVSNLLNALEPRFGLSSCIFFSGERLLRRKVETKDQASLGQQDRLQNLQETMLASKKAMGKRVLLVDDIVTTGSSLFESARALTAGGAEVLGFLTFAETILRKNVNSVTC